LTCSIRAKINIEHFSELVGKPAHEVAAYIVSEDITTIDYKGSFYFILFYRFCIFGLKPVILTHNAAMTFD
jgi:hypothetical protein